MNREKEICELPEWVKLVNRILREGRRLEDEMPGFDKYANSDEVIIKESIKKYEPDDVPK